MKKLLIVMLALAMICAFAACGDGGSSDVGASADPNAGVYNATSVEMLGMEMAIADVYEGECKLELKDGGKGTVTLDGQDFKVKDWSVSGGNVTVNIEGQECSGTIADGVIVIDLLDMGMNMTFVKEGASAPAATPAAAESDLDWWDGEWYGWWIVAGDSTGYYEDLIGSAWDICADIQTKEDGSAVMTLWDEDTSRSDPLGTVDLKISGDGIGVAEAVGGKFYTDHFDTYAWSIDPSASDHEKELEIVGYTVDFEGDELYYFIDLRPWGHDWADIAAEDKDLLPLLYDEWYMPLVKEGKPAPDTVGK